RCAPRARGHPCSQWMLRRMFDECSDIVDTVSDDAAGHPLQDADDTALQHCQAVSRSFDMLLYQQMARQLRRTDPRPFEFFRCPDVGVHTFALVEIGRLDDDRIAKSL